MEGWSGIQQRMVNWNTGWKIFHGDFVGRMTVAHITDNICRKDSKLFSLHGSCKRKQWWKTLISSELIKEQRPSLDLKNGDSYRRIYFKKFYWQKSLFLKGKPSAICCMLKKENKNVPFFHLNSKIETLNVVKQTKLCALSLFY